MKETKNIKKSLEELNIIDDFLFTELLLHPKAAQLLVRLIIERSTGLNVGELIIEPQLVYNGIDTNKHGIRMDVRVQNPEIYITEGNKPDLRVFDIEPDLHKETSLPKRVRYYQALSDVKYLESGEDYDQLPELWSIWILPYDPFKANRMIYLVKNVVEDLPEIEYNEDILKIFLYTDGILDGNEQLKNLLRYISDSTEENASDNELQQLHDEVQIIKHQKDIGVKYMRMVDYIRDEIKQGIEEGIKENVEAALHAEKQALQDEKQAMQDEKQAMQESAREMLLMALSMRGTIPDELHEIINAQKSSSILNSWIRIALDVNSIDEFRKLI